MASLSDKLTDVRNAARPNSARVSSTRSVGASTLACDNLAGWPIASKVHFVTYQIDSNSNPINGTQLDCQGIVSSNTITSFTVIDGSDVGHSVGDVVEMLPTAAWGQDLSDALNASHNRDGTPKTGVTYPASTFTAPTITDFTSANHDHSTTAKGGSVALTSLTNGAQAALVATSETTTNTTYVSLSTVGPSVTVTIGANGLALVSIYNFAASDTQGKRAYMGFDISGATTLAANDNYASEWQAWTANADGTASSTFLVTGLAAGSTTFLAKYRVDANTGTFKNRRIAVIPL